jgi:predicted nucleic acid-binding protein
MKTWLVDTGPFVAYLDRSDPKHQAVAATLDAFTGQLATTGAVVTEVMYFLSDIDGGPTAFAELLLESETRLVDLATADEILAAARLMERYADTPMDYADATLVLLGDELAVTDVLTLDRRGFSTYRTRKGRAFRIVDLAIG